MLLRSTTVTTLHLRSLSWYVHPPTPQAFASHLVPLLPEIISGFTNEISEMSRFVTELSVFDYFFVPRKSSLVAFASVLVAIECVDTPGIVTPGKQRQEPSKFFITVERPSRSRLVQLDCGFCRNYTE